jgi:hypothetical protein
MTPEILYALDLAKYGLSQREIAIRIFGEEAVKDGWDDISQGCTDFKRICPRE